MIKIICAGYSGRAVSCLFAKIETSQYFSEAFGSMNLVSAISGQPNKKTVSMLEESLSSYLNWKLSEMEIMT